MPGCHLLSALCCAMWHKHQTVLLSGHLSVQVKITFYCCNKKNQISKCCKLSFTVQQTKVGICVPWSFPPVSPRLSLSPLHLPSLHLRTCHPSHSPGGSTEAQRSEESSARLFPFLKQHISRLSSDTGYMQISRILCCLSLFSNYPCLSFATPSLPHFCQASTKLPQSHLFSPQPHLTSALTGHTHSRDSG